jgi:DNA-directed RNA polymerase III subunit RPC1
MKLMKENQLIKLNLVSLLGRGFSIGIGDVTPSKKLLTAKKDLLKSGYNKCSEFIQQLKQGKLQCQPGCNPSQTLEVTCSLYRSRVIFIHLILLHLK